MLIGIEASRANKLQKTGVEWYAYQVIQGMKHLPDAQNHSWLLYTNDPLMMGLEKNPTNWHEVALRWPPKYLWTQLRLSWEIKRHTPDVLFIPAHVLPRSIPPKSVVTIHDVGFYRMPELYPSKQVKWHDMMTKDTVKRASRILTVSEFSKRELIECYGAHPEQVFVTPLGINHDVYKPMSFEAAKPILDRFHLPTPYLAYVGRREPKKNVGYLIEAFCRYKQQRGLGDPLHLVLVGPPGTNAAELDAQIAKSDCKNFIHVVGYVNEEEKVAILSQAYAYIHPSWYEGFGLPPLEAMACGSVSICSRVASLPEVVGEGNAIWIDPKDPQTCVDAIDTLMNNPALYTDLQTRGQDWVKQYTWEKTAKLTLDLLTNW